MGTILNIERRHPDMSLPFHIPKPSLCMTVLCPRSPTLLDIGQWLAAQFCTTRLTVRNLKKPNQKAYGIRYTPRAGLGLQLLPTCEPSASQPLPHGSESTI